MTERQNIPIIRRMSADKYRKLTNQYDYYLALANRLAHINFRLERGEVWTYKGRIKDL